MIYTITFNPAIDLVMKTPHVALGDLNRVDSQHFVIGGKGINASVLLNGLGVDNVATGFIGGFTGQHIKQTLEETGIKTEFIEVEHPTRMNVKLKSDLETEINAPGAEVSSDEFEQLLDNLEQTLTAQDTVLLMGNAAPGLDETAYQLIAKLCQEKQARLVLDTNRDLLTRCLAYEPFVIKPNHHELGDIFGVEVTKEEEIIYYAKQLQQQGAQNVIVSCGGDGAYLISQEGKVYQSNVPIGTVVNSVGAGDSMVAGFVARYLETKDFQQALQYGAATGSATAFSVGIADKALVETLLEQIEVKEIKEGD
ncbi:1-phosphofructokinase [Dolosicoccus paucivorans]|uniref:1-phosphofructokinase n=1 Tax=Dolosicoccus paucivorans TaxID=84521 RepID=UPI000885C35D|nr:1-phosphofructokinase [Dolosicoccus paucivorans]SDI64981.1 fructose-1-phosphate kinase [Dolosicoccus paucivorans]